MISGIQPSSSLALVGLPSNVSTSVGRLTHTVLGAALLLFYAVHRRSGVNPLPVLRFAAALVAIGLMGMALAGWEVSDVGSKWSIAGRGELAFLPSSSRLRGTETLEDIDLYGILAGDWDEQL